jgi:MinD-like ATPase involved in chromosome partitioning or flagellar assembly
LASDNKEKAAGRQQDRPDRSGDPATDAAEPSAAAAGAAVPDSGDPAEEQDSGSAAPRAAGAHRLGPPSYAAQTIPVPPSATRPGSAASQDPAAADAQPGPADADSGIDPYGPPGGYLAGPYGGLDSPGETGNAPADMYVQADPYGPPDPYAIVGNDPAYPYGGYALADDPYQGIGHYGPPEGYSPSDPYGPPDEYQPADPYRAPEPYAPPSPQPPDGGYGAVNPVAAPPPAAAPPSVAAPPPIAAPPPAAAPPPVAAPPPTGPPHGAVRSRDAAAPPGPRHADDAGAYGPPPGHAADAAVDTGVPGADEADESGLEFLLPARRRAPSPGWRRVVFHASGGMLRVPASAAELRRRDMISRVRTPVAGGHHRVAVMSLKGGVGKTTTTVGLGSTLASLRGDRVIAVDANPDRGTLSDKVRLETSATVRDLLNERRHITRYADVRSFTSQAASRLEVLASDRDPTVSVAFSDDDYCHVARVLEHYYSICLTDCGTGLLHSAMGGVLRLADQIVLVSTASVDGARSASATLDWLAAHSYGDLVRNAVVVLSAIRPRSRSTVDLNRLEEHFAARCRAVTRVPYDSYLEEGAELELDQLNRATADAYLALAALIGDGLAWPRRAARAQPTAAAGGGHLGG